MGSSVFRRSCLSFGTLVALLVAAGTIGALVLDVPLWAPVLFAVVVIAAQYAIGPWLLEGLVGAEVIVHDGTAYATEHPIGEIVARRCRDAGVPLVKLGIIPDGTPNAFVFGHLRRDARLWISSGVLERLDHDELDAVVAHEVGHVKHNDFVVMTVASLVPVLLYYVFVFARQQSRAETVPVAVGAWVGYAVGQLAVLALSRVRELGADRHSCEVTGNGDALASALVKIAYGIGQVRYEQQRQLRELRENRESIGRREAAKQQRRLMQRSNRMDSIRPLGIADPKLAAGVMLAAEERGLDGAEVLGALRWESCNPWANLQEKLSTHPTVVHRIAALESSGLPGAPTRWHAAEVATTCSGPDLSRARRSFGAELALVTLFLLSGALALVSWGLHDYSRLGQSLLVVGSVGFILAVLRHPPVPHQPVDRVASLLDRLDASPVTGIPVSLRGRIVGRGFPGFVLSPDLVVADESGFVPVLYRQPLPFARAFFALVRANTFAQQEVLVRGWYRRAPSPVLELRDIVAADGARSRSWQWVAQFVGALGALALGALLLVA